MEQVALWKSLRVNGSIVRFWRKSILEKYVVNIREEGFEVYHFDWESYDKNTCLLELSNILEFPNYYGKNLDTFNDCVVDIVPNNEGFVLFLNSFNKFNERDKDTAYHVLNIIQNCLSKIKKMMGFYIQKPVVTYSIHRRITICWNNEEWLNKRFN